MDNNVGIKRKCGCCGEYLYVNKTNLNDVIYYDKITYHSNCFIEILEEKLVNETPQKNGNGRQTTLTLLKMIHLLVQQFYLS